LVGHDFKIDRKVEKLREDGKFWDRLSSTVERSIGEDGMVVKPPLRVNEVSPWWELQGGIFTI
jgi:hypothetical protein